jgi:ketosteroid isomerase-like protein
MSQEHVDAVRRSFDAWNRRDFDAWVELLHPEIEWVSELAAQFEGSGAASRGLTEMRRYWDEWHALWDMAIELTDVRDLGDTVIAIAHVRARGEASGVGLEQPIAYVIEFEDGLARRARSYFNKREALAAVGLSE